MVNMMRVGRERVELRLAMVTGVVSAMTDI